MQNAHNLETCVPDAMKPNWKREIKIAHDAVNSLRLIVSRCENATKIREAILLRESVANPHRLHSELLRIPNHNTGNLRPKFTVNSQRDFGNDALLGVQGVSMTTADPESNGLKMSSTRNMQSRTSDYAYYTDVLMSQHLDYYNTNLQGPRSRSRHSGHGRGTFRKMDFSQRPIPAYFRSKGIVD